MPANLIRYAIGAGSGVAAALLFLAAARGAPLAVALAYLAPLPIGIATLGWRWDAGLIGAAVAVAMTAAGGSFFGAEFALLVIALPAWLLAAVASAIVPRWRGEEDAEAAPRRLGPTALAMLAAALFIVEGAAQLTLMLMAEGGYAGAVSSLAAEIRTAIASGAASRALPADLNADQLAQAVVRFAPAALSTGAAIMHLINLYLAARSVQISQRLARPWPDIPSSFALPRWLAAPTIVAVAATLSAPAPWDEFGLLAAGPLGALYLAQGLATLHALSRRAAARPFMLGALYFACAAAAQWVLPALALLGLIESFVNLRARAARSLKTR